MILLRKFYRNSFTLLLGFALLLQFTFPGNASVSSDVIAMPGTDSESERITRTVITNIRDTAIDLSFTSAPYSMTNTLVGGEELTVLSVPGTVSATTKDAPSLPGQQSFVVIPPGVSYDLLVELSPFIPIDGYYQIAPASQPRPLLEDFSPGLFDPVPFSSISSRDEWFPRSPVRIIEEAWIRAQRVLRIEYAPFQYNPFRGELRWYPQVDASIVLSSSQFGTALSDSGDIPYLIEETNLIDFANASEDDLSWSEAASELSSNKGRAYPDQYDGFPAARISITKDGLYHITYADLLGLGFDVNHNPQNFHLYNQGRPVAYLLEDDQDEVFEAGEALVFYGQKFDGAYLESVYETQMVNWLTLCPGCGLEAIFEKYATENVYWLVAETTPGLSMATRNVAPQDTAPSPPSFPEIVRAEKQEEWWSHHFTNADVFFYYPRINTSVTTTYTYGITLTNVDSSAPAAVVFGSMAWRNSLTDHTTSYYLNYPSHPDLLATVSFDGIGRSFFSGTVSSAALVDGLNILSVRLDKNPAGAENGYFDYFEIEYWRTFIADDNQLMFHWITPGTHQFEIAGFTSSDVVALDISDPVNPILLTGIRLSDGRVDFQETLTSDARYIVSGGDAIQTPPGLRYVQPAELDAGDGADYVMIAYRDLITGTQALADYRSGQGMAVKVVDIADLYDQHNYGIRHPIAIRNYLERSLADWLVKPSYALLVGDGHYNLVSSPYIPNPANQMPPNLAFVDPWQGEVDSSSLLAMIVGDDRIPDIHIGRISSSTPALLQNVVDKIIAYEQAPAEDWQRHYLFMHDNVPDPDDAGEFDESAISLSEQVLSGAGTSTTILDGTELCGPPGTNLGSLGCIAARNAFTSTLTTQGALVASYIGHGSVRFWAGEVMAAPAMVEKMKNERLPVILSLTCLDGFWNHPTYAQSLAEYFLTQPGGGAVATVSPTGLGVGSGHDLFAEGFFKAMLQSGEWRLGALADAGRLKLTSLGVSPDLVYTFTVFGDPALRVKNSYQMQANIANPVIAGEPGETYTYTLQVENTAPIDQSFIVSLEGLNWPYQIEPDQLTLTAGLSGTIFISVEIPAGATRGSNLSFSVRVQSTGDLELSKGLIAELNVNYLTVFLPITLQP
jgi:hypothetical protein